MRMIKMTEQLDEIYEAHAKAIESLLDETSVHEATGELSVKTYIVGDYEIELGIAYKATKVKEEEQEINEGEVDE